MYTIHSRFSLLLANERERIEKKIILLISLWKNLHENKKLRIYSYRAEKKSIWLKQQIQVRSNGKVRTHENLWMKIKKWGKICTLFIWRKENRRKKFFFSLSLHREGWKSLEGTDFIAKSVIYSFCLCDWAVNWWFYLVNHGKIYCILVFKQTEMIEKLKIIIVRNGAIFFNAKMIKKWLKMLN